MDNENKIITDAENETSEKRGFKRDKIEVDEALFENSTVFCASEEKKKKGRLSPIKKGLISIGSLALLTAIVLVVVMFIIPQDNDTTAGTSSTESKATSFSVMNIEKDKISKVTIENENSKFTVLPEKIKAEDGSDAYKWLVKGYENIDFSTPEYMVSAVTEITALKKFKIDTKTVIEPSSNSEGKEENDEYGFLSPYANLTVSLTDNTEYKVTVGDVSPDKSGRYIMLNGDGNIDELEGYAYLIDTSVINCVGNSLESCVNLISAPAFAAESDEDPYFEEGSLISFDHIYISGRLHKKQIKIVCPSDELSLLSYMIEEPDDQAANDESVNSILTLTSGVYNSGAYVLNYNKSDLKEYGLDNPYVTYNIKAGNNLLNIKIGDKDENGYYAYIVSYSVDGGKTMISKDIIYRLDSYSNEFIEMKAKDIYFEKLFIEYVKYVDSLTVTIDGKDTKFILDHDEENAALFTVTTNEGKEIDEDEFCYYYTRLLYLSALENADESYNPGGDSIISFRLTYTTEGKEADQISIYPYEKNVRRCIFRLNGKGTALVSRTLVTDLINCLTPLKNGEKIGNKYAN
ncbi:MAG: DUF4340 domain-containing protein [Clostridia bacterium]|nr:DUF4340 domain-containing protein [Clostridia bacterium]